MATGSVVLLPGSTVSTVTAVCSYETRIPLRHEEVNSQAGVLGGSARSRRPIGSANQPFWRTASLL